MNSKNQILLLKVVLALKKIGWVAGPDWKITLKGEGHVPLNKEITVDGETQEESWEQPIAIAIDFKLNTEDEITFFPVYSIFGEIYIEGGRTKDINHELDADIAFSEQDIGNEKKFETAATKINGLIHSFVQSEFTEYIDANQTNINYYNQGGWKADQDDD